MTTITKEEKKAEFDRAISVIAKVVSEMKQGDNKVIECPICGGELVVYRPYRKKLAAKCHTDYCIKIVS
ncbi:hypothetical protein EDC14_103018 [Hydrogenispora ethanolica]|uniref:Uncharacterized protein n=1 Tax=Hydrogenispora ethanolica TaxID=1082276 RepID=A0A4R1R8E8_HYDET|nr:hypothetical protein [Hydrogenispora ethanolica]TCL61916.1 hypothetical protein EDC14_103018 [Hydrogenispora ethanolica]